MIINFSLFSCSDQDTQKNDKKSNAVNMQKTSEKFVPNYDEDKVPDYTLTDPLIASDGTPIETVQDWQQKRRPEIVALFTDHMFGRVPNHNKTNISFEITSEDKEALDGTATRKEVTIYFNEEPQGPKMHLLCYIPNNVKSSPAFLALNFYGNHSIHSDPNITLSSAWMRNSDEMGTKNNRATESSRGVRSSRWPVELILSKGFALVTAYYGDIDPDYDDDFQNGIHPLFYAEGQTQPKPNEWGSIAAWAWGLSRAMDYLETDVDINPQKIAVMGHSRLGKAALWVGAMDERFALVVSNNSGCGGAALSKRAYGETIARINTNFPHWFNDNFQQYNNNESALPFDQHMLITLIAPRPVYVASAQDDKWADPKGEFLSAHHARSVYELYEKTGPPAESMPKVNKPSVGTIAYHIRSGKHDVTNYDWEQYLAFAKSHFNY